MMLQIRYTNSKTLSAHTYLFTYFIVLFLCIFLRKNKFLALKKLKVVKLKKNKETNNEI